MILEKKQSNYDVSIYNSNIEKKKFLNDIYSIVMACPRLQQRSPYLIFTQNSLQNNFGYFILVKYIV